jgi:CIC family chloride channel protein
MAVDTSDTAASKDGANVVDRLADFTADSRLLTLTAMAVAIGVMSAIVAYLLVWLIGAITNVAFYLRWATTFVSPAANHLGAWEILVPVVGGLIVGVMARYGSEKIRGHGIPEAMEAILIGRSRIEPKVAILKPLSSALSIGTGGPFGAEGPIIMTGGAFGSIFAQLFPLTAAERKTLLVAGAAGGMSAIFASPVAAVLLAVELLLFEWKPRSFIPVATASAVAAVLRIPLLGPGPIFPMVPQPAMSWPGLAVCAVVGVIAGFASGALTGLVYGFEDLFKKLPIHWMWWPAIGGIFVGVGGLLYPRALGVGYDTIRLLLQDRLVGWTVLGLLITKAMIWSLSLGSGTSGGVLAPLLIMGGALGAIEAHWIPIGHASTWVLISMAAIMGGTMRSPFTAIVFLVELTHQVNMLTGLLVACVASDAVTVLLLRRSILTEKVARRGHHVMREYAVSPLQQVFVHEVMDTQPAVVPAEMSVGELVSRLGQHDPALGRHQAWPIVTSAGRLTGIITRSDLLRASEHADAEVKTVLDAGTASPVTAYPDELVAEAIDRMARHNIGRLPVVSRESPHRLVGYIGRTDLIEAWQRYLEEEYTRERGMLGLRGTLLRTGVERLLPRGRVRAFGRLMLRRGSRRGIAPLESGRSEVGPKGRTFGRQQPRNRD